MIITDDKKEEIKLAADIVEVIGEYVPLKKKGKDYEGLCPFHSEKTPSFSVSQNKNFFFCFGCGATGDVFEFLVKKDGISFLDAVMRIAEKYGIIIEGSRGSAIPIGGPAASGNRQAKLKKQEFVPAITQAPAEIWQEKAAKLVGWAHENLLKNEKRLAWLEERGIGIDLVKEFKLGWNIGENGNGICRPRETWGLAPEYKEDKKTKKILWMPVGYIIPLVMENKVLRIRFRPDSGKPKYILLPGSSSRCMVLGAHASRAYVLIETELDAIMVWGKVRMNKIGVVGLGTARKKPELETYNMLKKAPVILNALDCDPAGEEALKWWKDMFPDNYKRWTITAKKDPGEAYKYGLDIAGWIKDGLPEAWKWEVRGQFKDFPDPCSLVADPCLETFGRSDLLNDNNEGGAQKVSPIKELAALVKSSPVVISVSPGHLKTNDVSLWARSNPDKYGRISGLVFLNKEVRSFLMGLGSAELNSRNIDTVMCKRI